MIAITELMKTLSLLSQIPASKDNRSAAVASRRPLERSAYKGDYRARNERVSRSSAIKSVTTQPIIIPQIIPTNPQVVYQPPAYDPPNRYLNRQPEVMTTSTTGGTSVLVSNLSPKITEDEVAVSGVLSWGKVIELIQ